jgi:DNA repair photolyase
MNKTFKGKAIYQPSGKAAEYSKWAVNFYNGCSAKCDYCYNRHGIAAKVLGCDIPTLKKSLVNEDRAFAIFCDELWKNKTEIQECGLFFNFVSDPCLPETYELNKEAMRHCLIHDVPIKILTKQIWWVEEDLLKDDLESQIWGLYNVKRLFAIGFTLTGHDELEPGAAPNQERIRSMKVLHSEGFKTWASIEPIIDLDSSYRMIESIKEDADLLKIGLQSGKKYDYKDLIIFVKCVLSLSKKYEFKIYFKDSFLKQALLNREELDQYSDDCIRSDYNIFNS